MIKMENSQIFKDGHVWDNLFNQFKSKTLLHQVLDKKSLRKFLQKSPIV